MASNPLGSGPLLKAMAEALPTHAQNDPTSDMSSSCEALALFAHACMKNVEFRLLGFNEDQRIESSAPRLPPTWNSNPSLHSFVYAHNQSSMQFVIKVDRLGGKTEFRGMAVGDDKIHSLEVNTRDYVSSAALPLRITRTEGTNEEDRSDLEQKLKNVFVSEERIQDLASLLKIKIIQPLIPGLQKEGYEETAQAAHDGPPQPRAGVPQPAVPQPAVPAQLPRPGQLQPGFHPRPQPPEPIPGFDDELDMNRPRGPHGHLGPHPFGIGGDDLNPPGLGPFDPLRPSFTPGAGGPLRPGGFGGMHPTFDDPLFQGPGQGGQGGFDPQAPPGARWDPTGPGFGGNRPGRGGFGGGLGGGFGGDIV